MRRLIILLILFCFLPVRVFATGAEAPELPEPATTYMPEDTENFLEGILSIMGDGIRLLQPAAASAAKCCLAAIATVLLLSITGTVSEKGSILRQLIGTLVLGSVLLSGMGRLIDLGRDTVVRISEYGKLLIPVMTGALAAEGGITGSAALYAGTMFFDAFLTLAISEWMIPMLYVYLCICLAGSATGNDLLIKLEKLVKWTVTWALKISLYVFTAYMSITGVVSGTTDAAALKATKLTISGMVPVVGGILADASETVLVSAGIFKSSAGVYGLLAVLAIWIEPFITIGTQYLMLKFTAALCKSIAPKGASELVGKVSSAMGMLVAMTASVCLMLMVSIVCFMKGMA